MNNRLLYINIKDNRWKKSLPDFEDLSGAALDATFDYIKKSAPKPLVISLTLTNDTEIQALNKEFRNLDKPTNVLSFAQMDNEDFEQNAKIFPEIDLGDIIISFDTTQKEAKEKNLPLSRRFTHLFIHGLLHLLGHDHMTDEEADIMENQEIKILKKLNIPNPYTP